MGIETAAIIQIIVSGIVLAWLGFVSKSIVKALSNIASLTARMTAVENNQTILGTQFVRVEDKLDRVGESVARIEGTCLSKCQYEIPSDKEY